MWSRVRCAVHGCDGGGSADCIDDVINGIHDDSIGSTAVSYDGSEDGCCDDSHVGFDEEDKEHGSMVMNSR